MDLSSSLVASFEPPIRTNWLVQKGRKTRDLGKTCWKERGKVVYYRAGMSERGVPQIRQQADEKRKKMLYFPIHHRWDKNGSKLQE